MNNRKQAGLQNPWLISSLGFLTGALFLIGLPKLARTAPGLIGGPLTNGYFGIAITNGSANEYYQVEVRDGLEPEFSWRVAASGGMGQTNFSISVGPAIQGFYRVLNCLDCDGDGIPNTSDAHPTDTNIGQLSITIISPANGSTIN